MMEISFSSIYKILLYYPLWIIGVAIVISTIAVLCSLKDIEFNLNRRKISKCVIIFATLTGTIGLSFFYSIHSYYSSYSSGLEKHNNSLNQDNNKEELQNSALKKNQEHEIKNEKISASIKHEHIIKEIENAAIEKYKQKRTPAKYEDLPSAGFWNLTSIFFEQYLFNAFLSLSVIGSFIAVSYGWLVTEYRRFNDNFVEYSSQYYAIIKAEPKPKPNSECKIESSNEPNKELYLRKISYLLQEEYTMFFQMNMAYSKFKFEYLFKPYFYILNISYACGLDLYIDIWHHAFQKIAKSKSDDKNTPLKKLYCEIKVMIDEKKELEKEQEELEKKEERTKQNKDPNPYFNFIDNLTKAQ